MIRPVQKSTIFTSARFGVVWCFRSVSRGAVRVYGGIWHPMRPLPDRGGAGVTLPRKIGRLRGPTASKGYWLNTAGRPRGVAAVAPPGVLCAPVARAVRRRSTARRGGPAGTLPVRAAKPVSLSRSRPGPSALLPGTRPAGVSLARWPVFHVIGFPPLPTVSL